MSAFTRRRPDQGGSGEPAGLAHEGFDDLPQWGLQRARPQAIYLGPPADHALQWRMQNDVRLAPGPTIEDPKVGPLRASLVSSEERQDLRPVQRLRRKNSLRQPLQPAPVKLEMSPRGVLGFLDPGLDVLGNAGA